MFHRCKNEEDSKKLFRKLAMHLHPDQGGENDLMMLLKEHYQIWLADPDRFKKRKKSTSVLYEKSLEDIMHGDPRISIIDDILKYAEKHPTFNNAYTLSVRKFLNNKGHISSNQYNSLVKTYYAFKMHEKEEAN
jgi:curved DNA-binding protein CbpA